MSLASDLEKLQHQRREEIRTLHQTYLRTKRTVVRTASPARIVRKHMGVSLGIAAALGLLLAPRPSASAAPVAAAPRPAAKPKGGGILSHLGWMKNMVGKVSPQVASYIPDAPAETDVPTEHEEATPTPPPPPPRKKGPFINRFLGTLVKEFGALALSKVDFHKLMADLMKRVSPGAGEGEQGEQGWDASEPNVSVADVGTVKPHDYENFQ